MRLLLGSMGKIDFDAPLTLTTKQKEELLRYFKEEFEPVEITEGVSQFRSERLGEKRFQSPWEKKEYRMLLDTVSNDYLQDRMGRTWLSIVMKRKEFLPDFQTWLSRRGLVVADANETLIEEFLREKEIEKMQRKKERLQNIEAYRCVECGRYYDSNREKDRGISMPRACDWDGYKLKSIRIRKDRIEELKRSNKYAIKYDEETGRPLE